MKQPIKTLILYLIIYFSSIANHDNHVSLPYLSPSSPTTTFFFEFPKKTTQTPTPPESLNTLLLQFAILQKQQASRSLNLREKVTTQVR